MVILALAGLAVAVHGSLAATTATPLQQAEAIQAEVAGEQAKLNATKAAVDQLVASLKTPPPPPPPSTLRVGLDGLAGWGPTQQHAEEAVAHVKRDRIDIGGTGGLPWLREVVKNGAAPLVLYNPGLKGRTVAQVKSDITQIAGVMKELHLDTIDFGNETYYAASKPPELASQYRGAHEVLAGTGIKLLANLYGDYQRADGTWSQVEAGGGWQVDFAKALGYTPDGWTEHPYGPMTGSAFQGSSGHGPAGWATVPRVIANLKEHDIYAPIHVTEVGQPTWRGSDGNTPVSQAEQAADVKQYVSDAVRLGLAELDIFGAVDPSSSGEGGYGLWTHELAAKPAAGALGEAVTAAGVSGN